jgi:molybdopterin synthase sulfur carrier subunit
MLRRRMLQRKLTPTCKGLCGLGVTLTLPNGARCKARDAFEVRERIVLGEDRKTMPTVKVLIPTPLRKFTGDQDTVTVDAASIGAMLGGLDAAHPGLGKPLIDDKGAPRRFVNLFLNGEDIRFLQGTETPLKDGDEVSIVPAIAGGISGTEVYNFTLTRAMMNKPILFEIGKRFRVVTTIRRAILNEEGGWAEVALTGTSDEIGRAIAELQTTGVSVTGPLVELVEPDFQQYVPVSVGRGT